MHLERTQLGNALAKGRNVTGEVKCGFVLVPRCSPDLAGDFSVLELLISQRRPWLGAGHCGSCFLMWPLPDRDRDSSCLDSPVPHCGVGRTLEALPRDFSQPSQ